MTAVFRQSVVNLVRTLPPACDYSQVWADRTPYLVVTRPLGPGLATMESPTWSRLMDKHGVSVGWNSRVVDVHSPTQFTAGQEQSLLPFLAHTGVLFSLCCTCKACREHRDIEENTMYTT